MKRNDIIEKLTDLLVKESICSNMLADHYAENILEMLESEGMKPQSYYGLSANAEKYDKTIHQGRDVVYFYDWEPEDA